MNRITVTSWGQVTALSPPCHFDGSCQFEKDRKYGAVPLEQAGDGPGEDASQVTKSQNFMQYVLNVLLNFYLMTFDFRGVFQNKSCSLLNGFCTPYT